MNKDLKLDFGANGFPGPDRYLEIAVKPSGGGSLVTLAPRQKIGSAPYAVQSLQANTATTAMIASNAMALGGVSASQYILTSDPRLSDPRPPAGGSGNYIQNTVSPLSTTWVSSSVIAPSQTEVNKPSPPGPAAGSGFWHEPWHTASKPVPRMPIVATAVCMR